MSLKKWIPLAASLVASSTLGVDTFRIQDLGTLSATPSDGVRAASINNRGHVHGENDKSVPGGGMLQWRSFRWDGEDLHEIFPLKSGSTWVGGLNDRDQCVGKFSAGGGTRMHGYVWDEGPLVEYDIGDRNFSHLMDVNAGGICAGTYLSNEVWQFVYRYHAFAMNPGGQWVDLGTLGGYESYGRAINDRNHVVGHTRDAANHYLGYLWTYGGGMIDLGHLGGIYCDPEDLDNLDRIVGASADESGDRRPFLWEDGEMRELGTLGGLTGRAKSINDHGVIVGTSHDASDAKRGTLWEAGGIHDLNHLVVDGDAWEITGAAEINELGEIAGTGLLKGVQRAYKLTPILEASRVAGFQPGFAGMENRFFGLGFTPHAQVDLYYGLNAGATELSCGESLDISAARRFAAIQADAGGRIELTADLPAQAKGRTVLFQAVERVTCRVGELRTQGIH